VILLRKPESEPISARLCPCVSVSKEEELPNQSDCSNASARNEWQGALGASHSLQCGSGIPGAVTSSFQTVRVLVSAAKWLTWKRYGPRRTPARLWRDVCGASAERRRMLGAEADSAAWGNST
jgi:hypothetical protein